MYVKTIRYKLHLFVKDDTASCKIMLLDTVAMAIIGFDAKQLWDGSYEEVTSSIIVNYNDNCLLQLVIKRFNLLFSQIEDPTILPQPIQDLVGKSFCLGISISNDNVTNGADTFFVSAVSSGDLIHKIESQAYPGSLSDTNSSIQSGGEVIKDLDIQFILSKLVYNFCSNIC